MRKEEAQEALNMMDDDVDDILILQASSTAVMVNIRISEARGFPISSTVSFSGQGRIYAADGGTFKGRALFFVEPESFTMEKV